MNASVFMRMSSIVTALDLLDPLQVSIPAGATVREAVDRIGTLGSGHNAHASLILDDNQPVGWIVYWDARFELEESPNGPIRDYMKPLRLDRFMTASMPARRALQLLTAHPAGETWFVLDGNEIIGTIQYDSLFKPPFRICLFALVTELEQSSLNLCLLNAKESWDCLPPGRQAKAMETLQMRQKRRKPSERAQERIDSISSYPSLMLEYTMFIDKKTILAKRGLVPGISNTELSEVFKSMEELRNHCAHPESVDEPFIENPGDILRQVIACHKVLDIINDELQPVPPIEPEVDRGNAPA